MQRELESNEELNRLTYGDIHGRVLLSAPGAHATSPDPFKRALYFHARRSVVKFQRQGHTTPILPSVPNKGTPPWADRIERWLNQMAALPRSYEAEVGNGVDGASEANDDEISGM